MPTTADPPLNPFILKLQQLGLPKCASVCTHAPPGTLTLPTLSQKPCAQRVGTSSSWISILLPLKSESSYRQILCSRLSCREVKPLVVNWLYSFLDRKFIRNYFDNYGRDYKNPDGSRFSNVKICCFSLSRI